MSPTSLLKQNKSAIFVQCTGFCPGQTLVPFVLKNSRGRKKTLIDGPECAPNFFNQKTTKSDFHDIVLAF